MRKARAALVPVLVIGGAVVLLLAVAIGGYFFVYPRLRGGEAQLPAGSQTADASPATAIPAGGESSDASPSPASAGEPESSSREPDEVSESDTGIQLPGGEAAPETTSESRGPSATGGQSRKWPGPAETAQSSGTDTPTRRIPEPVSSPLASASEERQPTSDEPTAIEPNAETADRTPEPLPEETETAQAAPDRQAPVKETPAYQGPKKGVVIWTGEADKGMTVVIEGSSANAGQVQGSLPGVACTVRMSTANVAVAEGPGPRNGYRRIALRFNKKGRFSVPVEWEVLH